MSYREIAELSLKILAFYWLIVTINLLATNLTYFATIIYLGMEDSIQNKTFFHASTLVQITFPLLAAIIIFFFSKPLSIYIASSNEVAIQVELPSLHFVLLSIFGFIILTLSIVPLTRQFIVIFTETSRSASELFGAKTLLLGYLIQFFIGIWFAFGSKGISKLIYKVRYSNR